MLIGLQLTATARADSFANDLQLRWSMAGSLMMSRDQRGYLKYGSPGALSNLQLEYAALSWLSLQLVAAGGVFFSSAESGGLLAPMAGVTGRWQRASFTPYLALDGGVGFTGTVARPFARGQLGLDFAVSRTLQLGPVLGLDVVLQHDRPNFSSDAIYAWVGAALSFRPALTPRATPRQREQVRVVTTERVVHEEHEAVVHEPAPEVSPEIASLLDDAVHLERSELLAPVLFAVDSDVLDPTGIAMLHQVADLLTHKRKDISKLEIAAYADARGSAEYNRALSRRRSERVLAWLVEHGVARERLDVSAEGAVDFVEPGDDEANHQQNRRVIFRILRTETP
jgi:outer membrane protein OmpA-like peptidoglycan-associated protein